MSQKLEEWPSIHTKAALTSTFTPRQGNRNPDMDKICNAMFHIYYITDY